MAKKTTVKGDAESLDLGDEVEMPRIKEIDDLAKDYRKLVLQRVNLTAKEVAAKTALIGGVMKHSEKLPKDDEGTITYRNGELEVLLKHGKDSLKVKEVGDE